MIVIKVIKKIAKILLVVVCVYVVASVISYANRPYSPTVSVENIRKAMERVDGAIFVKVNDRIYEIECSYAFAKLFAFDEWEQTQKGSYDAPVIAFCLAEEWIIDLHSDGSVTAYDGYALRQYKKTAHYAAPAEVVAALSDFIAANGELEDRIFERSFYH